MQSAYYSGMSKVYELGGTGCQTYIKMRLPELDVIKFEESWYKTIQKHDMLRMHINEDGTQQVVRDVERPHIEVSDEKQLEQISEEMSIYNFEVDEWPKHMFKVTKCSSFVILHFCIDMLIADYISINIILNDVFKFYFGEQDPFYKNSITFRDIVMHRECKKNTIVKEKAYLEAKKYWEDKISKIPGRPMLPVKEKQEDKFPVRFRRYRYHLCKENWYSIQNLARSYGVTASNVVLGLFSEVISRWSINKNFGISLTLMDRSEDEMGVVGDFTSVEILSILNSDKPFLEKVKELQHNLIEDMAHSDFSGLEVLRELNRRKNINIIFPVVYTSTLGTEDNKKSYDYLSSKSIEIVGGVSRTPQVWIDCHVIETIDGLEINWDIRENIFEQYVIDDMFRKFSQLLEKISVDDKLWESTNIIEYEGKINTIRHLLNQTCKDVNYKMLYQGFVDAYNRTPEKIALVCNNKEYSYDELGMYVAYIQEKLLEKEVKRGEYVGIALERGILQVASVLAVSLLGAVFAPVDIKQPFERQIKIVDNLKAKIIILEIQNKKLRNRYRDNALILEDVSPNSNKIIIDCDKNPDDVAYIIHTSGTTGVPKGVSITHKSAYNTIHDINTRFKVKTEQVFLSVSKLAFDLSIYDLFGCFDRGGTLVLPNEESAQNPSHWIELIEKYKVNIWNSVPALFRMLINELREEAFNKITSINLILLSGDVIGADLPKMAREYFADYKMFSLGGATEAAIWSIYYDITDYNSADKIPYGIPLANQRFYVLDSELRECPNMVFGELCIGGMGLAQEYINDDFLTSKKFVYIDMLGERLYRTGDIGRYKYDGVIEISGRVDDQIKINGHRIEIGEIENSIKQIEGVKDCAVIVSNKSSGPIKLTAFIEKSSETVQISTSTESLQDFSAMGKDCFAGIEREKFAIWKRCSDLAALADMLHCFIKAGVFTDTIKSYSNQEIHDRIQESDKYYRTIDRMLRALQKEGYIEYESGVYTLTAKADVLKDRTLCWKEYENAEKDIKYSRRLFEYQKNSGEHILEQVRGEMNALNLFFPKGETEVALAAYQENIINHSLNKIASMLVNRNLKRERHIKILEIGAGVGGTTKPIIENLYAHNVEYCFTDISYFFINNAKEIFADYNFMDYKILDINKEFEQQGFLSGTYDIIICANVLHNSKDISEVLARINDLLVKNGTLLIIEATNESYSLLTSLELKGGLDNVVDDRREKNTVFMLREEWKAKLDNAGFAVVSILPDENDIIAEAGQSVFYCKKLENAYLDLNTIKEQLRKKIPEYMIPNAVRFLKCLPLNVNHKVDKNKLRELCKEEETRREELERLESIHEQDDLTAEEKEIIGIWKEVLNTDDISKNDNFYSVGGDSLLIAQVVTKMKKGIPVFENVSWDELMKNVLNNPTVEGMGKLVHDNVSIKEYQTKEKTYSFLHIYKKAKERKRVQAFFHTGTGRLIEYKPLVAALKEYCDPYTELVGFTYGDYEEFMAVPIESLIKERARMYAECLIELNADEYDLVGYCVGGFFALEAARIMLENGKKVRLIEISARLCLHKVSNQLLMEYVYGQSIGIDMSKTIYSMDNDLLHEALCEILNSEHRNIKNSELTSLSGKYKELGNVFTNLLDLTHEERLRAIFDSLINPDFNEDQSTMSMLNVLYGIFDHTFQAMMSYRPEGIYVGNVLYFDPVEGVKNFFPDTAKNLPWKDIVLGNLEVKEIPGGHGTAINEENYKNVIEYFL